jgi:hypothetical protein
MSSTPATSRWDRAAADRVENFSHYRRIGGSWDKTQVTAAIGELRGMATDMKILRLLP